MKKFLIITSVVYVLAIFLFHNQISSFLNLEKSNELGDFLAGVFAPLAFLWLVFGYFLQQKELKQSTETLKLQAKELNLQTRELKNTVEQQTHLVKETKRQNELQEEALQIEQDKVSKEKQPSFEIGGGLHSSHGNKADYNIIITNTSEHIAYDLNFSLDPKLKLTDDKLFLKKMPKNQSHTINWDNQQNKEESFKELKIIIKYKDYDYNCNEKSFTVELQGTGCDTKYRVV